MTILQSSLARRVAWIIIALFAIGGMIYLPIIEKAELLPTFLIGCIAAILANLAHYYTRERLRLDLFEKRFEIYERTLEFCRVVTTHASLRRREDNKDDIDRAISAAQKSFRGIGLHKTRALFGPDIENLKP